jgi:hypothetical protein
MAGGEYGERAGLLNWLGSLVAVIVVIKQWAAPAAPVAE